MSWIDFLKACYEAYENNTVFKRYDEAIVKIFNNCEYNQDYTQVVAKIGILNGLYGSGPRSLNEINYIADRIVGNSELKTLIMNGDQQAVEFIRNRPVGQRKSGYYSFATKYCHFHNPKSFPIYDNEVRFCLEKWKEYPLCGFPQVKKNLQYSDYTEWCELIIFIKNILWQNDELAIIKTDKALWLYMQLDRKGKKDLIDQNSRDILCQIAKELRLPKYIGQKNQQPEWGEFT